MYSDKFVEPKKNVLSTFILGIFIIAPLQVFHYTTVMILGEPIDYNPFFRAFFKAAFLEELFKFCVLYFSVQSLLLSMNQWMVLFME